MSYRVEETPREMCESFPGFGWVVIEDTGDGTAGDIVHVARTSQEAFEYLELLETWDGILEDES